MITKQISLNIPQPLFQASKEYSEEYGFRSVQEFIVDLIRHKVFLENRERYQKIEERMKRGVGVKRFNQKDAIKYLQKL